MAIIKGLVTVALAAVTGLAAVATLEGRGVEPAESPQGVDLRDEGVRRSGGSFFAYYAGRGHRGGGPRYGK